MNIEDLKESINLLADEDLEVSEMLQFLNDGMARINIECTANFPFITLEMADYTAIPEKWLRSLLVPFAVGRIKQQDSSQFEYSDAYGEFLTNLASFQAGYKIPDEYKDTDATSKVLQPDFSSSPFRWDCGW